MNGHDYYPHFDQTNPDGATLANSLLDRAQSEVAEASRAGKLKLIGRRNRARPDEVQTSIFWDRSVTANWWDTIEDKTHRICWTDIQCRTSEVLAIWPARNRAKRGESGHESCRNGWDTWRCLDAGSAGICLTQGAWLRRPRGRGSSPGSLG